MPIVAATGSASIGFAATGLAVAKARATGTASLAVTTAAGVRAKRAGTGSAGISFTGQATVVARAKATGRAYLAFDAEALSPAAAFSVSDYTMALLRLAPRGRVWSQDPQAVQGQVAAGLAAAYRRSDDAGRRLLLEALPAGARALLPEWEATVGARREDAPTVADRRRVLLARFAGPQGPSIAALQALSSLFGLTLTVTSYAPFRAGLDVAGAPVRSEAWAHALSFDIGAGPAWAQAVVAERLAAMTPAHVVPLITIH